MCTLKAGVVSCENPREISTTLGNGHSDFSVLLITRSPTFLYIS